MYELLVAQSRGDKQEESTTDIRKQGFVPAVLFGRDIESLSLKIQQADLLRILSKDVQIFEVKVADGKKHLVNVQNIQRDILKGNILHISLQKLKKGENTTSKVPVVLIGARNGGEGAIVLLADHLNLIGLPQDIPSSIEIDITGLIQGATISSDTVKLPVGVKLADNVCEVVRHTPAKEESNIALTIEVDKSVDE